MTARQYLVATVILSIAIAGCVSGETDPGPGAGYTDLQLDYYNESGFYNGSVYFNVATTEDIEFQGVMLCFYDTGGDILAEENLGTFRPPASNATFQVNVGEIAHYIVIDHPKFREYGKLDLSLYVWADDHYRDEGGYLEDQQDEFPYPRNDMDGQCG